MQALSDISGFSSYVSLLTAFAVNTTTTILAAGSNTKGVIIGCRGISVSAAAGSSVACHFLYGGIADGCCAAVLGSTGPAVFYSSNFVFVGAGAAIQWVVNCTAATTQSVTLMYRAL